MALDGGALTTLAFPLFQSLLGSVVDTFAADLVAPVEWTVALPAMFGQVTLDVTFLAYRGVFLLDAIGRTLVRMFWTRRKLLEWETAASTERRLQGGLLHVIADMWMAPATAIAIGTIVFVAPRCVAGGRSLSGGMVFFTGRRFSGEPAQAARRDRS